MTSGPTSRDILKALLLSLTLTLVLAVVYVFYPIIAAIPVISWGQRDGTGGIGVVAGGLGESFLWAVLLLEPVLFLITFVFLRRSRSGS